MEPNAIVVGIGPQIGFEKIEVTNGDGTIDIKLTSDGKTDHRDVYITDTTNTIVNQTGAVVTPDGILTTFQGELVIPNIDMTGAKEFEIGGITYSEVVIVAGHLYLEDANLTPETTLRGIPNTTLNSINSAITSVDAQAYKGMDDWYDHAIISGGLDKSSEVIIGLALISQEAEPVHKMVIPYHYKWPQSKTVPTYMWDNLYNRVATLEADLLEANKHKVQKGILQMWDGKMLSDMPAGNIFCGVWLAGMGTNESIMQNDGTTTTRVALEALLNTKYNSVYGTEFVVTTRLFTAGIYYFLIDFSGVTVNDVYIPNISTLFLTNSGVTDNYIYSPGTKDGANTVKLTGEQSGVQKHTHTMEAYSSEGSGYQTIVTKARDTGDTNLHKTTEVMSEHIDALAAHENRPAFYAVSIIKKVI